MLVLSSEQIEKLLSLQQIMDAVEDSMRAYEDKSVLIPKRMHLDNGKNTLLCMPSWGKDFFGTKLVAVAPENANKNLPVTNGAMILNDSITGMPLALINASKLTALRTGAVGAIGIKYLTPENETSIGLIGCGVQGIHQILFACAVRPIKKVFYLNRPTTKIDEMTSFVKRHHADVTLLPCNSPEELLEKANIIIAATTSPTPVLPNEKTLLKNKHFISIGSYKPGMQELPDAVYQLAGELCIDSDFARQEVGDIINPLKLGFIAEENVYTIGTLVNRKRKLNVNETTVFKSAGMALFDLYVAGAMYREAIRKNLGTEVAF
ncbi:ornithine cyclodeaminase [Cytophagales bacterium WSM2-2]|nr:ornithine cyclodeaminase [Cytophagales bacterium WSM2-2]